MNKKHMDLIRQAKELGLSSIKIGDVELFFTPRVEQKVAGPVPEAKAEELITPPSPFDDLTEEEIAMWSTPEFDRMQEEKAKRLEARNNEVQNG